MWDYEEHFWLVDYEYIIMKPAYVHLDTENMKEIEELKCKLREKSIYCIGRYGDWKYCSIEDCIEDALEVSKLLLGESTDD